MGKFDGFLICSDLDGTFWRGDDGRKNFEAVKYFTKNGGHFAVTTGRNISHLKENKLDSIVNAPCCLLNGSIIYDYSEDKTIWEKQVEYTLCEFLEAIKPVAQEVTEFTMFGKENVFFKYTDIPENLLNMHSYKMLCMFENCEAADKFVTATTAMDFFKANSYISKSWDIGVEFNPIDATKGTAIEYIKRHLGSIHTSIGIGDYDNDIPLLKCADIGVAVGNAVDGVKKVADFTVNPCTEAAIKDLIEKIEKGIIKK